MLGLLAVLDSLDQGAEVGAGETQARSVRVLGAADQDRVRGRGDLHAMVLGTGAAGALAPVGHRSPFIGVLGNRAAGCSQRSPDFGNPTVRRLWGETS